MRQRLSGLSRLHLAAVALGLICATTLANIDASARSPKKNRNSESKVNSEVVKQNSDGSLTVNTTSLASGVRGYAGPTPLEIKVRDGKIVYVKPLPNRESPGYFRKLTDKGYFDRWKGMSVSKASTTDVDGVTGATYSSKAVQANVKAGMTYLLKH